MQRQQMSPNEFIDKQRRIPLGYFVVSAWMLEIANVLIFRAGFMFPAVASHLPFGMETRFIAGGCMLACLAVVICGLAVYRVRGWWLLLPVLVEVYSLIEFGSALSD
jgi:hypothetical protein